MEYPKIINLSENTPNQPCRFKTKNLIEINNDSRGTYNTNSQIKFKTSMLKSRLCGYSDADVKGNDAAKRTNERNKGVILKNCAPFTDCISEINNIQVHNVRDLDVLMTMYNLIEYSGNYSKTSGNLWKYYRDEPNDTLTNSESFKSNIKKQEKRLLLGIQKMLK